jgi:hypothetical protein
MFWTLGLLDLLVCFGFRYSDFGFSFGGVLAREITCNRSVEDLRGNNL